MTSEENTDVLAAAETVTTPSHSLVTSSVQNRTRSVNLSVTPPMTQKEKTHFSVSPTVKSSTSGNSNVDNRATELIGDSNTSVWSNNSTPGNVNSIESCSSSTFDVS